MIIIMKAPSPKDLIIIKIPLIIKIIGGTFVYSITGHWHISTKSSNCKKYFIEMQQSWGSLTKCTIFYRYNGQNNRNKYIRSKYYNIYFMM